MVKKNKSKSKIKPVSNELDRIAIEQAKAKKVDNTVTKKGKATKRSRR